MNLISLELNRNPDQPDQPSGAIDLVELLRMLISGIALHSIESDHADFRQFQQEMSSVAHSLPPDSATADLMAAIVKALQLLEAYNQKIGGAFKDQLNELRGMISAMNDTLQFIVSSSEISVKQLGFMESHLNRAAGLEDLRQLRTYTSACLTLVRKETVRVQAETQEKIAQLKQDVQRLQTRLDVAVTSEVLDPVTGLPSRPTAEQDIANRIASGKPSLLALFYIDRIVAINSRFGNAVGDQVIMQCTQFLAKRLNGAKLYRWSGPAICAVFDPIVPLAEAESRARVLAAQQLEQNVGDGSVLIVVGFVGLFERISSQTVAADLFQALDALRVGAS